MRVQHCSGMFKQNSAYCSSRMFSPLIWLYLLATKWDKPSIPDATINKHEYEETGPFWKLHDGRRYVYRTQHFNTIYPCSLSLSVFISLSLSISLFTQVSIIWSLILSLFLSSFIFYIHLTHLVAPPFC